MSGVNPIEVSSSFRPRGTGDDRGTRREPCGDELAWTRYPQGDPTRPRGPTDKSRSRPTPPTLRPSGPTHPTQTRSPERCLPGSRTAGQALQPQARIHTPTASPQGLPGTVPRLRTHTG